MRFQDLKIDDAILKAIHEIGYDQPTPIQEKAIPIVLEGHDLLGCAQTGTGRPLRFPSPCCSAWVARRRAKRARCAV